MRLKIQSMGTDVEGIILKGDPRNPEPIYTRIMFPGGSVDVTRTTDDEYWVHIEVNHVDRTAYDPCAKSAEIVDGRVDNIHSSVQTLDASDAYHFAFRVGNIKDAKA